MPTFLARLMASQRGREFVSTLGVMLAVIVVVAGVGLLAKCTVGEKVDQAVKLDAAEVSIEATSRTLAAERAAMTNQIEAERAFANDQAQAEDKIDEAARTRRSPLDAVFGELR
jgi:uncharacterized protein YlxW (UPF0749 family)